MNVIKELGLFERVDRFLNQWGAWISLTVILMECTKLFVTIVMIAYSLSKDGILGARAVCYSLLCTKVYSTRNHLERAKRRRLRISRGEMCNERQELQNMKESNDDADRGDI